MVVPPNSLIARRLLQLSETGMGYQILRPAAEPLMRAIEADYVLAWNAEYIEPVSATSRGTETLLEVVSMSDLQRQELSRVLESGLFRVLDRADVDAAGSLQIKEAAGGAGPASEAEIEKSAEDERFLRFSAFENDRRITPEGSVVAGTYTTTYSDGITNVFTGMDAVRRYALPNPMPAVHRFYLKPPDPIAVRRGTAAPAFGQPGGGVEVLFENGAGAGTRYDQDELPPGEKSI